MNFDEVMSADPHSEEVKERLVEAAVQGTPTRLSPDQVSRLKEYWTGLLREIDLSESAALHGTALRLTAGGRLAWVNQRPRSPGEPGSIRSYEADLASPLKGQLHESVAAHVCSPPSLPNEASRDMVVVRIKDIWNEYAFWLSAIAGEMVVDVSTDPYRFRLTPYGENVLLRAHNP